MTSNPQSIAAITQTLRTYEKALNDADVEAAVALYTDDGVFMAQHRSPASGAVEIRQAYTEVFGMIELNVEFILDEVVPISDQLAYARTRSAGQTTIKSTGDKIGEANQELFILKREDSQAPWRIFRYIFSTTNPPLGH
jgi:uncharacterized protein (TIGR02246 family)